MGLNVLPSLWKNLQPTKVSLGIDLMLTLSSILRTTKQMTAFGERGTGGALDHLPERVQGKRSKRKTTAQPSDDKSKEADWCWDEAQQTYIRK